MSKQINIEEYISMYINEKIDILKNYPITEVQEAVEVFQEGQDPAAPEPQAVSAHFLFNIDFYQ